MAFKSAEILAHFIKSSVLADGKVYSRGGALVTPKIIHRFGANPILTRVAVESSGGFKHPPTPVASPTNFVS